MVEWGSVPSSSGLSSCELYRRRGAVAGQWESESECYLFEPQLQQHGQGEGEGEVELGDVGIEFTDPFPFVASLHEAGRRWQD